jgi:hypothetical protein
MIKGKVTDIRNKAKLQVRYLTPYNFFIAPAASPINNGEYDDELDRALNAVLKRNMTIRELADLVRKLPRNPREDFM